MAATAMSAVICTRISDSVVPAMGEVLVVTSKSTGQLARALQATVLDAADIDSCRYSRWGTPSLKAIPV